MSRLPIFLTISLILHAFLLIGLKDFNLRDTNRSTNFSKKSGASSIKIRLAVRDKKAKAPKEAKEKTLKESRQKKNSHSEVEDLSKSERESGSDTLLASYLNEVRSLILKNKFKSHVASRLGLKGTVEVGFKIASPNQLMNLEVLNSSGKEPLDDSALRTVRRVDAFPAIPESLKLSEIAISLEVEFD